MQLIERLAGHLEQGVQRGRVVVVLAAGRLLLPGGHGGRRIGLRATGDFGAGATLAAVRAGPSAGARGRLVVGRLRAVLMGLMMVMMMMLLLLLLLEVMVMVVLLLLLLL